MRCPRASVVLLCGLILAACGGRETAPAPPPAASAPATAPDAPASWPTFHGPATLDGVADVALPDKLAQLWKFSANAPVANTPVVGNGHVFFSDTKGTIYALDLDGKLAWSKPFELPGPEGKPPKRVYFDSPLAIFDGALIAGSSDGLVYALNPADGSVRWQCDTQLPILGTPTLAEVMVDGKAEKRIYLIDQTGGGLQSIRFDDGKLLWQAEGEDRCDAAPAANGSVVAFGSCASAVHMFSPVDGKKLREVPLDQDSQIAGGVVLLGDDVYSGTRSGSFIHVSAKSGEILWTNKDCDGEVFTTPAVNGDTIVFGANNATLYALDRKTGALKWKRKLSDTPTSPVIARDKIVVAANGTLQLLRLADGEPLWSLPVSDQITSPAMAGARIIVGGDDSTVTAFGAKIGE